MKKYILLSMMALGTVACTDSFLEEEMVSVITQDYFDTEQGLEQLIVGTYDAYRVSKQYTHGPYTFLSGLDYITPKSANIASYSGSEWSPSGKNTANQAYGLCAEFTSNSLLGYYPIINNCNRAIQTIRGGAAQGTFASNEEYASLRMSEALLNRAYCIYIMNTMYGDVYIPREYTKSMPNNFGFKRESSESLYAQMIGDLRYAFEHLPAAASLNMATDFGRGTKEAAAHFLAKLYLQRVQGSKYGTAAYGRQADGSIDTSNDKAYLGMLYKGTGTADLDSCIYFASQVIDHSNYFELEQDYRQLFSHPMGDYSNESSKELILSCMYGSTSTDNGRYGNRLPYFIGGDYSNKLWGIPDFCWEYPSKSASRFAFVNDFGYDLFVNKQADSRYEKSFHVEFKTAMCDTKTASPNIDYYAYNNAKNASYTWTEETANYFNENILPNYTRASWGERRAVAGEHKMGTNDLGIVWVENTRETAIDVQKALAQPFYVRIRWIKDGDKYYYRVPTADKTNPAGGTTYEYNTKAYNGLDVASATAFPASLKYDDPNRTAYTHYNSYRDVPIFRLGETYLLRAEAYGRKGDYDNALKDINAIRTRAAYKAGETRAEVIARLQPGYENLETSEQQYPYKVAKDMVSAMLVDRTYWNGTSANSKAERYPGTAQTEEDYFVNFILNELARELNFEMIYYENLHHSGWQADRILYNNQMASNLNDRWGGTSDNLVNGKGQTDKGQGSFMPHNTLKPFTQSMINMLTDESGQLLDESAKKAYQNPGY